MEQFFTQNADVIIKLVLAMVLGMIIGIERYIAHRTAGMRTYALLSMGSALFIIISEAVTRTYISSSLGLNPLHIAAAMITGIGFLGAGVMLWKESTLVGLTTATSFWTSAGIGMAVGFGFYSLAIISTVLILFVFLALWFLEHKIIGRLFKRDDSSNQQQK